MTDRLRVASTLARVWGPILPRLHRNCLQESARRLVQECWPRVPVVHRADSSRLPGVVSLDDVLATRGGGQMVRRTRGDER